MFKKKHCQPKRMLMKQATASMVPTRDRACDVGRSILSAERFSIFLDIFLLLYPVVVVFQKDHFDLNDS